MLTHNPGPIKSTYTQHKCTRSERIKQKLIINPPINRICRFVYQNDLKSDLSDNL